MAHLHSIYDTDQHFIIDPISRSITSEADKVTLMQNDHNSERFTFELPRYIEGHDMSLTDKVEVHYNNIDGSNKRTFNADIYEVADLQISPDSDDVVICSWLISKNATTYAGTLNFVLRFVCYSEEEIEYQWFTDVFTGIKVLGGIYNVDVIADNYDLDILESWKRDIVGQTEGLMNQTAEYAAQAAESAAAAAESQANIDSKVQESAKKAAEEVIKATEEAVQTAVTSAENAKASEEAAEESAKEALTAAGDLQVNLDAIVIRANEAHNYAKMSKSYAVGDTGARDGEDTDNAKYYSEVANNIYSEALTTLNEAEQALEQAVQVKNNTKFEMNYETGELEVIDPDRKWSINYETGNLEVEVI